MKNLPNKPYHYMTFYLAIVFAGLCFYDLGSNNYLDINSLFLVTLSMINLLSSVMCSNKDNIEYLFNLIKSEG